ncbi:MAG TPA: hypothetical protein VM364_11340 [Vicinamibacterales bacterium]|nr:hypothetical protein [Vicinamibacterales bacterium]
MRCVAVALALLGSQACLVLTVHPSHEKRSLVWEPALVGEWLNSDDNSAVTIERAEWQSYSIEYAHPIERGRLTGYLTRIGDAQYLDVMPGRGEDRGAFLLPVHATLRVVLDGDRLELTALSYDYFFDRLKKKDGRIPGLEVVFDEKENALVVSPTAALRGWLRKLGSDSPAFGAPAVFTRKVP